MNGVHLESRIWLYVIHSKNGELIHLLEDNHVPPPNNKYDECLVESIKCHHNDISNYIQENLIDFNDIEKNKIILKNIFKSHNYEMIPNKIKNNFIFYYFCRYNYSKFVNLYIKPKQDKIIENKLSEKSVFYLYDSLTTKCS